MIGASLLYAGVNVVGLFLYIFSVRAIQHPMHMEERGADFGDSLNFLTHAVPVLLFFAAWNGAWGIAALVKVFKSQQYGLAFCCAVCVLAWAFTILTMRRLA